MGLLQIMQLSIKYVLLECHDTSYIVTLNLEVSNTMCVYNHLIPVWGKLNAELFEDKYLCYCIFCLCLLSNVLMFLLEDSPLVPAQHTGGQCRSNDPTMLLIIFAGHLLRSSIVHFVSPNERINFKFTEAIL